MNGKKILFVSSELVPYLPENEVSLMSYETPKMVNSNGGQIRIFMPRYGNINERRHQLHEVIRLSGMNLIINDMDMPLIIKVASIPKERIQVFFAKGVVETVKKLNWSPDIIHVHGWLASLLPLYLKKYYADEPLFGDSKIVTSVYKKGFEGELDNKMIDKVMFDGVEEATIEPLKTPDYNNLLKVAVNFSDAVILASEEIPEELTNHISNLQKPVLPYVSIQEFEEAYANFYSTEVLK